MSLLINFFSVLCCSVSLALAGSVPAQAFTGAPVIEVIQHFAFMAVSIIGTLILAKWAFRSFRLVFPAR